MKLSKKKTYEFTGIHPRHKLEGKLVSRNGTCAIMRIVKTNRPGDWPAVGQNWDIWGHRVEHSLKEINLENK